MPAIEITKLRVHLHSNAWGQKAVDARSHPGVKRHNGTNGTAIRCDTGKHTSLEFDRRAMHGVLECALAGTLLSFDNANLDTSHY